MLSDRVQSRNRFKHIASAAPTPLAELPTILVDGSDRGTNLISAQYSRYDRKPIAFKLL